MDRSSVCAAALGAVLRVRVMMQRRVKRIFPGFDGIDLLLVREIRVIRG
jgi:hypothetical protein